MDISLIYLIDLNYRTIFIDFSKAVQFGELYQLRLDTLRITYIYVAVVWDENDRAGCEIFSMNQSVQIKKKRIHVYTNTESLATESIASSDGLSTKMIGNDGIVYRNPCNSKNQIYKPCNPNLYILRDTCSLLPPFLISGGFIYF